MNTINAVLYPGMGIRLSMDWFRQQQPVPCIPPGAHNLAYRQEPQNGPCLTLAWAPKSETCTAVANTVGQERIVCAGVFAPAGRGPQATRFDISEVVVDVILPPDDGKLRVEYL